MRSDLSIRAFAARNHIGHSTLCKWRYRFLGKAPTRQQSKLVAVRVKDDPVGVAVSPAMTPPAAARLEIALPGGIAVRVEGLVDTAMLANVLSALRQKNQ